MIKIFTKATKVSKRNIIKSLNIVKKFMKMLRIMLTDREKVFFYFIFICQVIWGIFEIFIL